MAVKGHRNLEPVHPGEILLHDFMQPMGITKYRLAKAIHVPATRIGEIIAGRRAITPDTDVRLCRFFGLSNGLWMRLQVDYDVEIAESMIEEELATIEPFKAEKRTKKSPPIRRRAS